MRASPASYAFLESLESAQLNLGLYATRVTAEDLHRAIEEVASLVSEVKSRRVRLSSRTTPRFRANVAALPARHQARHDTNPDFY